MTLQEVPVPRTRCTVRVWPRYMETHLPDGAVVKAAPHDGDPEYAGRAQTLGYGDDIALLCRHHELAHSWLAGLSGLACSPMFWIITHRGEPRVEMHPRWDRVIQWEEARVLAFQRAVMTDFIDPEWLARFWQPGEVETVVREFREWAAEVPVNAP